MAWRRGRGRRRRPPHGAGPALRSLLRADDVGPLRRVAGIAKSDAKKRWAALAGALVPVQGVRKGFVLEEDRDALMQPPASTGGAPDPGKGRVHPGRDREVLLPDSANRKAVFPILGGPGLVLHEALPVGTWRGAAKARRYAEGSVLAREEPCRRLCDDVPVALHGARAVAPAERDDSPQSAPSAVGSHAAARVLRSPGPERRPCRGPQWSGISSRSSQARGVVARYMS